MYLYFSVGVCALVFVYVVPHELEASVCGAPQVGHVCVVLHELDMCQERGDNKMGCANVRPRAKLYS